MVIVTLVWQLNQMTQKPKLIAQFLDCVIDLAGRAQADACPTCQWSWVHPGDFSFAALGFCGLRGASADDAYVHHVVLMQLQFFANAQLKVVEIFLKNAGDHNAFIFTGEDVRRVHWSGATLNEVERITVFQCLAGFVKAAQVIGYLPNLCRPNMKFRAALALANHCPVAK